MAIEGRGKLVLSNQERAQQLQDAWEALEDAQLPLQLAVESSRDAAGQLELLLGRAQQAAEAYVEVLERIKQARRDKQAAR